MLRLVQNLNFYIMFEVFKKKFCCLILNKDFKYYLKKKVLEVSWKKLEERLETAKDMDDVIEANETFLDTIISQLLLDQNSTVKKKQTNVNLRDYGICILIEFLFVFKGNCQRITNDIRFDCENVHAQRGLSKVGVRRVRGASKVCATSIRMQRRSGELFSGTN